MATDLDFTASEYRQLADLRFHIRRFLRVSEEAVREEGLETQQHQFLLAIRAHTGALPPTVGELAERLLIRHHSAVGLADRLARCGLVRRAAGERDRRQVHVQLTEEGTGLLERLGWLHRQELRQFAPKLMEGLAAALNAHAPEALRAEERCRIEERA